ncbi:hypothetical protein, partial [Pseudomonas sp. 2995-1]|uniref:hypothetical protein n=1 Tax=Pseudomonas sp. 2995-1 TaxID=1712679 RepID=UPI001C4720B7
QEIQQKKKSNQGLDLFHRKAHFWGRLTLGLVIILSLLLPLYLSFVLGYHPGWEPIITAYVAYAMLMGLAWTMEPVLY